MHRSSRRWLMATTCAMAVLVAPLARAADPVASPAPAAPAPAAAAAVPASGAPPSATPAPGKPVAASPFGPAPTAAAAPTGPAGATPVVTTGKPAVPAAIASANAVVVTVPTAQAATPPDARPPAPRPVRSTAGSGALNVVGTADHSLTLEMGRGELIRLSRPAANVFVADPTVANVQVKSPTVVYVFGLAAGDTNVYALDDQDGVLLNVGIQVTHNLSRLRETLAEALPDSDVKVTTSGNSLILSGTVRNPTQAADLKRIAGRFVSDDKQLVNNVGVDAPTQVNLRVRIAEISRDVQKTFGINWVGSVKIGNAVTSFATGNPVLASQLGVTASQAAGSFFAPQIAGTSTIAGTVTKSADLNYLINALETENLVSVLAEPNLTAQSGETASFLAGGEFPIPVVQGGGSGSSNAISVSFKTYGVQLAFTPTILDSGRINLRVRPEVSQLSSQGAVTIDTITVDALTTRRADTTVELGSGQSLAIGGLLQHNVNESVTKFPWLADVPVIGALFRSGNFQRNETELVIVVTPYIVRPASDRKFQLPNDGFYAPNDIDRMIGGKLFRQQLAPGRQASVMPNGATRLIGPVGFEME